MIRTCLALWRRELGAYFLSPIAYVTTLFFLVVMGFGFWVLAMLLAEGVAVPSVMMVLLSDSPFFGIAMLMIVPLITMRLVAEEKRSGTMETLLTAPVSEWSIVIGKYLSACTFFVFMWLPTGAYAWILLQYTPFESVDVAALWTSYLGVFLVGGLYLAVGLLTSSLTRNQIVAGVFCFAVIGMVFFAGFIPSFARTEWMRTLGRYISSVEHMREFTRGVVDIRPLVFYTTTIAFFLFASVKTLESRNWK